MKKELITKIDAKSPVSEVFRSLRTNIQYMSKSSSCQTILVTSTTQGEGKSWIVSNLAVTFAQTGKNVIIIDADMRRPRQNNIFGIDMFPGLSNYLAGMSSRGTDKNIAVKDCIQATEIDNLYVLPAGNIPPNPSELLESTKTKELLNELKKIFDVVIFDGAPCLLVTDATIISRIVDSTILVASYKTTKIDELKDAKRRIEAIGGHVAGVVLNRTKLTKKKYENSYYSSSIELTTMKSDASRRRFVEKEDDEVDKDEKAQEILEEIKRYNKGRRAK
ncbi:capsular exopolysaccharide family protein [Clostridium sp. CAG:793]|jgi:capsular exopolysaccharide synthesis family protein|nr:capsular exopolysaccharide family protein [Clostridium sp. CAG:793]